MFKLLLAGIIGVAVAGADGFRGQPVVAFSMFPMVDRVKKDFLALTLLGEIKDPKDPNGTPS
eukprot:scaffold82290_cov35-Attheya_sp.AAC.1